MSTEPTKATGEDSGTSPAGLCPSHPEDPKGGIFPKEGDVLPSEMLRDDAVASVDTVVPDRVDADQEADPGNHMKTPGAEAVGELSLGVEGDRESQNSPEVLQAHEEEQAVEGQAGVAESLSMTSLSRSITKEDVTCLKSPPVEEGKKTDRMREIGRSQTVPRSFGAQSRRAAVQKAEAQLEAAPASTGAKVKPQRSTSLGKTGGSSVKQKLLEWCRQKTRGYQHVDIQNFSSSWNDGMAFCALVHKFFPDSFDYTSLAPKNRRLNFELAFSTAEGVLGCPQLLEVADLLYTESPDWKCIYTYLQELYRCLVLKGIIQTSP